MANADKETKRNSGELTSLEEKEKKKQQSATVGEETTPPFVSWYENEKDNISSDGDGVMQGIVGMGKEEDSKSELAKQDSEEIKDERYRIVPTIDNLSSPEYKQKLKEFNEFKPEINLSPNSSSKRNFIADAMDKMPVSAETQYDIMISRFDAERKNIEKIKNDPELSESVKQALIDDYYLNIEPGKNSIEDVKEIHLTPWTKAWLKSRRHAVEEEYDIPVSRHFGEGGYKQKRTVYKNTPEDIELAKMFELNSKDGRLIAEVHKKRLDDLEVQIDPLIEQGRKIIEREREKGRQADKIRDQNTPRPIGALMLLPSDVHTHANKDYSLADKAIILLKDAKKILAAGRDEHGFWKGITPNKEEFYNLVLFSESLGNSALNNTIEKYKKDPKSLTDEENLIIQAKFIADQIRAGVETNEWFNLGETFKDNFSTYRDLIATLPLTIPTVGASTLGTLVITSAIKTLMSPSFYDSILKDMQGTAMYKDENGIITFHGGSTIKDILKSRSSEFIGGILGDVALNGLFSRLKLPSNMNKSKALRFLGSQSKETLSQFMGMKYVDLVDLINDEQTISDFFDPKSNMKDLTITAITRVPFRRIDDIGYQIAKSKDIQAKQNIIDAYNKAQNELKATLKYKEFGTIGNFNKVLQNNTENNSGKEAFGNKEFENIQKIDKLIEKEAESELQKLLLEIAKDDSLSNKKKQDLVNYAIAASVYNGLKKAEAENKKVIDTKGSVKTETNNNIEEVRDVEGTEKTLGTTDTAIQEATDTVNQFINPSMDALVTANVLGVEEPVHISEGNIVLNQDGSINYEKSDQEIPIKSRTGKVEIVSIKNLTKALVESREEIMQQVIKYVTDSKTTEQENDEVREYTPAGRQDSTIAPKNDIQDTDSFTEQEEILSNEMSEIKTILARAPKQENGKVDYMALVETSPADFAVVWEAKNGKEHTIKLLQATSRNLAEQIEAELKIYEEEKNLNILSDTIDRANELDNKRTEIENVINKRYRIDKQEEI